MQRTVPTYQPQRGTTFFSDLDTMVGNALAAVLAFGAIACGVVGMLVAFAYIDTTVNTPFDNGMVWLVSALVLAISANAFRREHHTGAPTDYRTR
jgi:hypothetical protein